ncbi:MAG: type II secretion system secretin GspD [Moraxellaceae bacterium]|nr:type II secretion system secretin GspD [Moraxellaceae bacterium]MDZ4298388.1 type II secretion system secretin GspD [Moraxellaceae bacterium]MDZ4387982.1 type II secretion system secretin GspD [Moraxellaceae bacterium]
MKMPILKPLALSLILIATPVLANQTWKINLKDADISALVSEMAEITGKNFVVDPRVKGTVTVVSSKALNARELYELFQSVLSINGFAAVPSGPVVKIMPDANARQSGVRVDLGGVSAGEQLVTRVVVLEQANANELLAALRPMMPQFAHMAAVPGANALVISDRANNADAMEAIIRELDSGQLDDAIEIMPVVNSKAADLLTVLESVETGAAAAKAAPTTGRVRIVVDERSNRLIVRGDRALRDRVRALVRSLDEAPEVSMDTVRVFRLQFANARQVAEVLRGVLSTGEQRSNTSTTTNVATNAEGSTGTGRSGGGATTITVGSASLIADESQNALIVRATSSQIRQVETVLKELDVRRAQVLIQAAIVEVSGDNAAQLGVQWAAGDPSRGVGIINFNNAGASIANLAIAATTDRFDQAGIGNGAAIGLGTSRTDSDGNRTFYGALIQALNSVTDANLLSTPSIMTLDNQEAKIVVGQNVPFITGSTATGGSGVTNPFTTIERQDVGITLKVTPTLSGGGTILLEVEQEVSSVVPSAEGVNSADLITNKRSIKTTILADDGQTIVLGGLVQDDVTKSVSKVPFLGDIPGLGVLFRSTSDSRIKRNLLVFLQPTVIRDTQSANALTQRQYGSIRRVDLGIDSRGRLTRLPENIQEIYQGGRQRDVEPSPAPTTRVVPQSRSTEPTIPPDTIRLAPSQTQTQMQPRPDLDSPTVFAAELPQQPIQATPMPASPAQQPQVQQQEAAPRYMPPMVQPSNTAQPFTPTQTERSDAAFAPMPMTQQPAPAPAAQPQPVRQREIRTSSGSVYYVPDDAAPAPAPAQTTSQPATSTEPKSSGRMREIRTSSGAVYYVPDDR